MGKGFLSTDMSRRDALKTGLKGSVYAAPIVLGATGVQSVGAASPPPTATTTAAPTPTSTTTAAPVPGTPSLTVTPSSGPAGTPFTVTLANFPASTTGTVNILSPGVSDSFFELPVTTDANGSATVVFRNFSAPPGSYQVNAFVGNTGNTNKPTIQITAPALLGAVTVTSVAGCNPVFSGSGFPTGVDLNVIITSPSGTTITGFNTIQTRPDGTFQLFGGNSLPAGSLNLVVSAGPNVLNKTTFAQTACVGNQPSINANQFQVVAGTPLAFTGFQFSPGSTLTVSARSNNGTLLGSTPVTADGTGQFSGTLSTTGFPVGDINLVVTATGSNTVLAVGSTSIV